MTAMTELFYRDPYVREFTSKVISCVEGEKGFEVMLEDTAFYPEGGGQPADHGTIDGAAVFDVRRTPAGIVHYCEKAFDVGQDVKGVLDWERRFDNMQNHTGEHVFSGIVNARFGFDNVGFHMDDDVITCDFSGVMTEEQVAEVERACNEAIVANVEVGISFPDAEALEKLAYRSKKALTGRVRIVSFPGADTCACCGTHVLRSGQVGLVKFLSVQKFREGVRIELLCGKRALEYLSKTWEQAKAIGQRLSVKPVDSEAAVERLEGELANLKLRCVQLEESVFESMAKEQAGKGNVLLFQPAMRPDSVRRLMDAVSKTCGGLAAVFSGEEGHYAYALGQADGQDISPLVKAMNTVLHGRGGGRNGFAQGSVETERSAIEAFFKENGYGICD